MSARPVVLCAGALHHEIEVEAAAFPRGDLTVAGRAVRFGLGGRGALQAAAAARAGAEVHLAGAVGSDDVAISLRAALDEAGVRRGQVQTHPGPSGLTVATVLPDGTTGRVVVPGANQLLRADAVTLPRDCAVLLLQSDLADAANLTLAARARAGGVRAVVKATSSRALAPGLLGLIDVLIVDPHQAAALLGRAEAGLDATRAAEDLAAQAVIVTQGRAGLIIAERGGLTLQPAHPVPVRSLRGAGDAFVGALVAELARGAALALAAAFGQAAAGLHVSLPQTERPRITEAAIRDSLYA